MIEGSVNYSLPVLAEALRKKAADENWPIVLVDHDSLDRSITFTTYRTVRIVKRAPARRITHGAIIARAAHTTGRVAATASPGSDDGPPGDPDPPFPALRLVWRQAQASRELRDLALAARDSVAAVVLRLPFDVPLSPAADRLTALAEAA
jgi:hypothetical protein